MPNPIQPACMAMPLVPAASNAVEPPAFVNVDGKVGVSRAELTTAVLMPTKASVVPPPFRNPTEPMALVPATDGVKVRSQVLPALKPVVQAVPPTELVKVTMVNLVVPVKNAGAAAVPVASSVGVTDGNWRVVFPVVPPAPPPPKLTVQVVAVTDPLIVKVPESDSAFR